MGQPVDISTAPASPESAAAKPSYLYNVNERLGYSAIGLLFGFPIGLIANLVFPQSRDQTRKEGELFALVGAGLALVNALIPTQSNKIQNILARVTGGLTGFGLADAALPAKEQVAPLFPKGT